MPYPHQADCANFGARAARGGAYTPCARVSSPAAPVTPLGAKGVAEGNAMSTPACIANAVADALGVAEISVPLTPERMLELLRQGSSAPRHKVSRR